VQPFTSSVCNPNLALTCDFSTRNLYVGCSCPVERSH